MLLALDISTKVIGVALFDLETQKLLHLKTINLKRINGLFEKLNYVISIFEKFPDIKFIVIEEPFKKLTGNLTSSYVLHHLTTFNAMVSTFLYLKYKIEPIYIDVNFARKSIIPGIKYNSPTIKHDVWEYVQKVENYNQWLLDKKGRILSENYDMTDAYILGRAFFKHYYKISNSHK